MKIIRSGTKYSVYDNGIETYDQLPVGTYAVGYNQNEGCYLIKRANIQVTEKTYGVHNQKAEKVMTAYRNFERSLGVILSGDKGIGKSLFAKKLCENALQADYPVVIIDACLPGIGRFIESIDQECVEEIRREIKRLSMDESEKLRRVEALQFQIQEIERAELKPGEDEELENRRHHSQLVNITERLLNL